MEKTEAVARAKKDLMSAKLNLERAVNRNAPQQDIVNIQKKIVYFDRILFIVEHFWDEVDSSTVRCVQ